MSGNGSINSGDSGSVEKLGNLSITIPGVGEARLFDMGEKKLPGYSFPKETWGYCFVIKPLRLITAMRVVEN
ncbi:hypothetical protein BST97_15190 [Nonlabens spongiae]|uniref:Uncharacterized protein n=2 Tax=Nonlabens spongiae TaxID=331648 RepID=A0A1W6MNN7_9FLAO|nr:hypothetical protein BST97_15190 [Nonlabens spongiae]